MTTTAAAAGSWTLGDLAVNRMGFGAMRLAGAAGMIRHLGISGISAQQERAQLAAPVPHRTAGRGGPLIIGHSTYDRPRIPRPLASCQVVALPGAAGAG